MAKIVIILIILFCFFLFPSISIGAEFIGDKLVSKFSTDINRDGKKELIVHDDFGGTSGFGELKIYNCKGLCIFDKKVEGDTYLWHPVKHIPALNPDYFPDLDKDGVVEIIVGRRAEDDRFDHVGQPWWFDVYKWDGRKYILADDQFPEFYKEELSEYKSIIKEKGEDNLLGEFVERSGVFAGLGGR
jgi:hypothetical protein